MTTVAKGGRHLWSGAAVARAALAVAMLCLPPDAGAQTDPAPPDPAENARVRIGPVSVRPTLIVRDVGVDSNVFNESGEPREDFSATVGAKVDVGMRLNRVAATYTSTYEYVYFQEFTSERGSNGRSEGRVDLLLGRLRPHVFASLLDSHERPNAEIDARARRRESSYGAGVEVRLFAHTSVTAGYKHDSATYSADELFSGVRLADVLDAETETLIGGFELELTPLTSLSFDVEQSADRFLRLPERDAESRRYGATVTFLPAALVAGRARVAYRQFDPRSSDIPDISGLVAAVSLSYAFRDQTHVKVTVDRDIRYSFADLTPYYLSTAGGVTVTQRIHGPLDVQVVAARERLAYEARAGALEGARRDSQQTFGGGVGYRLGGQSRLSINIEHTERSSPVEGRRYTRRRIVGSLTYGL